MRRVGSAERSQRSCWLGRSTVSSVKHAEVESQDTRKGPEKGVQWHGKHGGGRDVPKGGRMHGWHASDGRHTVWFGVQERHGWGGLEDDVELRSDEESRAMTQTDRGCAGLAA